MRSRASGSGRKRVEARPGHAGPRIGPYEVQVPSPCTGVPMKRFLALAALALPSAAFAAHAAGACCPGWCCVLGCPFC